MAQTACHLAWSAGLSSAAGRLNEPALREAEAREIEGRDIEGRKSWASAFFERVIEF